MAVLDGIDISSVQPDVDWPKVAAGPVAPGVNRGFRFAVAKCTEGETKRDPSRLKHLAGARSVGLYTMTYHYAYPGRDPIKQAALHWDAVGQELPHMTALDLEEAPVGMTDVQLTEWTRAYTGEWANYSAVVPALYTFTWFLEARLGDAFAHAFDLASMSLWLSWEPHRKPIAWYPLDFQRPRIPPPWSTMGRPVSFVQYSGNYGLPVPGVRGACDRNLFLGDEAALRSVFQLPPLPPTIPVS